MAVKPISQLRADANTIRNETFPPYGKNTALRVGGMNLDTVDTFESLINNINNQINTLTDLVNNFSGDLQPVLNEINLLKNRVTYLEQLVQSINVEQRELFKLNYHDFLQEHIQRSIYRSRNAMVYVDMYGSGGVQIDLSTLPTLNLPVQVGQPIPKMVEDADITLVFYNCKLNSIDPPARKFVIRPLTTSGSDVLLVRLRNVHDLDNVLGVGLSGDIVVTEIDNYELN